MKIEAINDLIKMVKNEPYFGLELTIEQTTLLKARINATTIIPSKVIEDITDICKKHELLYYYRVNLDDRPEIIIFEDEEPF